MRCTLHLFLYIIKIVSFDKNTLDSHLQFLGAFAAQAAERLNALKLKGPYAAINLWLHKN